MLDSLKIILNQLKDLRCKVWNSDLEINQKQKLYFEYDLEIKRTELLIIQEKIRCLQDNTTG